MPDLIDLRVGQFQSGREAAFLIAEVRPALEFVDGEKIVNAVGEMLGDVSRIVSIGLRSVTVLPAAGQGLRQVPVK